jgi:hypothetical protein
MLDLSKLVASSLEEGRRAMDERELQLRERYGLDESPRSHPPSAPAQPG